MAPAEPLEKKKNERREREKQLFHQKCVMKCRSSQNKHHRRAIRRGSRRVANKGETHEQQPFTSLEKLQHHIRAEPRGKSVCKYEVIKTRDSFFLLSFFGSFCGEAETEMQS